MTAPYVAAQTPTPAPVDGKLVARLTLAILGALGSVAIALVFGLIWLFTTSVNDWGTLVILIAVILALVTPVVLSTMWANWSHAGSNEGGRGLFWWTLGSIAIEVVCIGAIVVMGFVSQPWLWVPLTLVILAVGFTAIAILLGRVLRSPAPLATDLILDAWRPPKRGNWFWWIVAGIFLIIGGLALSGLQPWTETAGHGDELRAYVLVLSLPCITSAIACIVRYLVVMWGGGLGQGRSYALRQRMSRAVFHGRTTDLSPAELEFARRTAFVYAVAFPWQLGYICLFYVGLLSEQLPSIPGHLNFAFSIFLAAALVVMVVVFVRYIVLARRFLRVNGEPSPQPGPALVPAV